MFEETGYDDNVAAVCPVIAVPPVAAVYHLKVLPAVPVPETEQEGVAEPHWLEFVAVGAIVAGLMVTALVVAVLLQPVVAFVAVTVYVLLVAEAPLLVSVVVPVATERVGELFQDHVKFDV